jgi:hypothetical protein
MRHRLRACLIYGFARGSSMVAEYAAPAPITASTAMSVTGRLASKTFNRTVARIATGPNSASVFRTGCGTAAVTGVML